jgi:hypothetical protein
MRNLTVTLIRTDVLQRSWYQMPGWGPGPLYLGKLALK